MTEAVAACVADLGLAPFVGVQYYEHRLGAGQDQVDYLAAFSRSAAPALQRALVAAQVPWPEVLALVARWTDGRSLMSDRVPVIWFELDDLRTIQTAVTVPSVSVCLVPGYGRDLLLPGGAAPADLPTVEEVLATLGVPRSRAPREVFAALPAGGRWIHLSVMLGRTPAAVKLYGTMPRGELAGYLRRIDWAGDHGAIAAALAELLPARAIDDEIFVDLNLENARARDRATLGLAVAQQHVARGPLGAGTGAFILDRWVAAGLATPEKAAMARGWAVNRPRSTLVRFLDLKLVWAAGPGLAAKAYLGQHQTAPLF